MKKLKHTKLKKKEITTSLTQTIEQVLEKLNNEGTLKKVRKTIQEAAEKITKEFYRKLEKENSREANSPGTPPIKGTNKNFIKNLKGKPSGKNIKEALKI